MPHNVAVGQMVNRDIRNILQNLHRFGKTAFCAARQIDLRDVAGDEGFGAETKTR